MHWRKVRIVRGWLCWRKWSRSDDADSHFRSFLPCLVSLGLIPTCSEVSSPQTNIVQGFLELYGPHTTPIYAPIYFCPHKQGFWPHSPPCKSAQIVLQLWSVHTMIPYLTPRPSSSSFKCQSWETPLHKMPCYHRWWIPSLPWKDAFSGFAHSEIGPIILAMAFRI